MAKICGLYLGAKCNGCSGPDCPYVEEDGDDN